MNEEPLCPVPFWGELNSVGIDRFTCWLQNGQAYMKSFFTQGHGILTKH